MQFSRIFGLAAVLGFAAAETSTVTATVQVTTTLHRSSSSTVTLSVTSTETLGLTQTITLPDPTTSSTSTSSSTKSTKTTVVFITSTLPASTGLPTPSLNGTGLYPVPSSTVATGTGLTPFKPSLTPFAPSPNAASLVSGSGLASLAGAVVMGYFAQALL